MNTEQKAAIMQGAAADLVEQYSGKVTANYARRIEDAFAGASDESLARLYDILDSASDGQKASPYARNIYARGKSVTLFELDRLQSKIVDAQKLAAGRPK